VGVAGIEKSTTSSEVKRASDAKAGFVQDMGVDLGGGDMTVPEQFLHRADVIIGFKEMGGEGRGATYGRMRAW
jgi:hypothetical protein